MKNRLFNVAFILAFILLYACSDKNRGLSRFNSDTQTIEDIGGCKLKQIVESSDSAVILMQHVFVSNPVGDSLKYFLTQKNGWKLSLSIPCFSGRKVNSKVLHSFFQPEVFKGKPSRVVFNTFAHEFDLPIWLNHDSEKAKSSLLWSVSIELEGLDKFHPIFDIQNGTVVNFLIIEDHVTNSH